MWKYVMACYGAIANQASYLHCGEIAKVSWEYHALLQMQSRRFRGVWSPTRSTRDGGIINVHKGVMWLKQCHKPSPNSP